MKNSILYSLIILPMLIISSLIYYQYNYDPLDLTLSTQITDIRIYRDTPAWELAWAVHKENIENIKQISKENPALLDIKDPHHGAPLIYYAVQNEKYESLKALLEAGANPDIRADKKGGETALFAASCFSAIDNDAKRDPKFVKLLLDFGANPNLNKIEEIGSKYEVTNISPLMHSVGCGEEKTLLLYNAGSNIFHEDSKGNTVLYDLIRMSDLDSPEIIKLALDLVIKNKLPVNKCTDYLTHSVCLVDKLRELIFLLDSEKHKIKMQIVEEFSKQGVDYWTTPIPENTLKQIKRIYPDTWQEYIKKY